MKSTQSGKSGKSFPANPSKSHLNNSKWAWPGLDATGYPVPKRFASFQALNTENWIPLGRTTTFQIQDTPPYFTLGRTNKSRKLRNYIFHQRELFRGYVKCWGVHFSSAKAPPWAAPPAAWDSRRFEVWWVQEELLIHQYCFSGHVKGCKRKKQNKARLICKKSCGF